MQTKHNGNIAIYPHNAKEWQRKLKHIKTITGYLSIHFNSNVKLEALQIVGGYLFINSNVKLEALQVVGGYLSVNSNSKLEALQTVGGYLFINSNSKLEAPVLQIAGGDLW